MQTKDTRKRISLLFASITLLSVAYAGKIRSPGSKKPPDDDHTRLPFVSMYEQSTLTAQTTASGIQTTIPTNIRVT